MKNFASGLPPIADPEAEDIDVERKVWTPTPTQFRRYREREVEMAQANLAAMKGQRRFNTSDTLHSRVVLWRAMQGEA